MPFVEICKCRNKLGHSVVGLTAQTNWPVVWLSKGGITKHLCHQMECRPCADSDHVLRFGVILKHLFSWSTARRSGLWILSRLRCSRVGIPLCRWSPGAAVSHIFGYLGAGFVLIYTRIAYQSRLLSFVYFLCLSCPPMAVCCTSRERAKMCWLKIYRFYRGAKLLVLSLLTKLRRTQVV